MLYQHLDLASLSAAAARRAAERLFVASALWGVVAIGDRIPAYRMSMGATLPRIPNLARWWRRALARALPADAFVVDLRSAPTPPRGARRAAPSSRSRPSRSAAARASRSATWPRPCAARSRGCWSPRSAAPGTPEDVAALVERAGERVELRRPAKPGAPWSLEIVRG